MLTNPNLRIAFVSSSSDYIVSFVYWLSDLPRLVPDRDPGGGGGQDQEAQRGHGQGWCLSPDSRPGNLHFLVPG